MSSRDYFKSNKKSPSVSVPGGGSKDYFKTLAPALGKPITKYTFGKPMTYPGGYTFDPRTKGKKEFLSEEIKPAEKQSLFSLDLKSPTKIQTSTPEKEIEKPKFLDRFRTTKSYAEQLKGGLTKPGTEKAAVEYQEGLKQREKESKEYRQPDYVEKRTEAMEKYRKDLPADYKEPGAAGQFIDAIKFSGIRVLGALGSMEESLGIKYNKMSLVKEGEKAQEKAKKIILENPEWQDKIREGGKKWKEPDYYARLLGDAVPSLVGAFTVGGLATIAAGGNVLAGMASTFAFTKTLEGGMAFEELRSFGASAEEAQEISAKVGTINGFLEFLSIGRILNKVPGGKQLKGNILKRVAVEMFKQGLSEAPTEFLQEVVLNSVLLEYDENRGLFDGALEAFAAGGLAGMVMGGGSSFFTTKSQINRKDGEDKKDDDDGDDGGKDKLPELPADDKKQGALAPKKEEKTEFILNEYDDNGVADDRKKIIKFEKSKHSGKESVIIGIEGTDSIEIISRKKAEEKYKTTDNKTMADRIVNGIYDNGTDSWGLQKEEALTFPDKVGEHKVGDKIVYDKMLGGKKEKTVLPEVFIEEKDREKARKLGNKIIKGKDDLMTPEGVAKNLIRGYVERGDTIKSLKDSLLGHANPDGESAQISGYLDGKKVSSDFIIVERLGDGTETKGKISLKKIYDSIKSEEKKPETETKEDLDKKEEKSYGAGEDVLVREKGEWKKGTVRFGDNEGGYSVDMQEVATPGGIPIGKILMGIMPDSIKSYETKDSGKIEQDEGTDLSKPDEDVQERPRIVDRDAGEYEREGTEDKLGDLPDKPRERPDTQLDRDKLLEYSGKAGEKEEKKQAFFSEQDTRVARAKEWADKFNNKNKQELFDYALTAGLIESKPDVDYYSKGNLLEIISAEANMDIKRKGDKTSKDKPYGDFREQKTKPDSIGGRADEGSVPGIKGASESKPSRDGDASQKIPGKVVARKKGDRRKPVKDVGNGLGEAEQLVKGRVKKTSGERLQINEQVEKIVDKKGDKAFDPDAYSKIEKELLSQYSGYGGIKGELDDTTGALDEFFTPSKLVRFTYEKLVEAVPDISQARVIVEPAIGTGNFVFHSPFDDSKFVGFEKNKYSAAVSQVLNPGMDMKTVQGRNKFVRGRGYVEQLEPENFTRQFINQENQKGGNIPPAYADLVVGNPPYGKYEGTAKGLGEGVEFNTWVDYFIGRGLAITKPGGHLAYVVSSSFLRSGNNDSKKAIAKLGRLVSAYRFPNGVFADTQVGTDLVIFERYKDGSISSLDSEGMLFSNDEYFENNFENILGEEKEIKGKFGPEMIVEGKIEDIPDANPEVLADLQEAQESVEAESVEVGVAGTGIPKKINRQIVKKVYTSHKTDAPTISIGGKVSNVERKAYENLKIDGSVSAKTIKDISPANKLKYFSYRKGKWYADDVYTDNTNLYDLLSDLEDEKSVIGEEQYKKQKVNAESVIPAWTKAEEVGTAPQSKFWEQIIDSDGRDIKSNFTYIYLRDIPNMALEGLSRDYITRYVENRFRISNNTPKEEGSFIKKNIARITNKLFKNFLVEVAAKDETMKRNIENRYNRTMNAMHFMDHSKIPIGVKVLKDFVPGGWELNPGQKRAIGFLQTRGKGIGALDVGVGKTITGIISVAEAFRKGTANKALIVVPRHGIGEQWIDTIKKILPQAHIYDFRKRKDLIAFRGNKLKDKSFSVVMPSALEFIGLEDSSYDALVPELLEVFNSDARTNREKENESERIKGMLGFSKRGSYTTMEEMGFDYLVSDEIHNYNHVIASVPSQRNEETGIKETNPYTKLQVSPSARGRRLWVLAKYLHWKKGNQNVMGLSATPFANSPLEMYSIPSFTGAEEMRDMGIMGVRDFVDTFMEMEEDYVVKPNLTIEKGSIVKRYINFDGLRQFLNRNIIKIDGEEAGVVRPKRIDKDVKVESTQQQYDTSVFLSQEYTRLVAKAKGMRRGSDEHKKAMGDLLRAQGAMVQGSFSQYATDYYEGPVPDYKKFVENTPKLLFAAKNIKAVMAKEKKAQSIIYIGRTQNKKLGINFHDLFKKYLVKENGLKPEEVDIISGKVSDNRKVKIQDQYNAGKVKVLIGSSAIMEGLDLQRYTTDIYITTPFWNFVSFVQLAGRGWRQGNIWKNIRIWRLMAKNTGDVFVTQKIAQKEHRDFQVSKALKRGERITEMEGNELPFDEVLGELLTDPVQIAQIKRQKEEGDLRSEMALYSTQIQKFERIINGTTQEDYEENKKDAEEEIESKTKDIAKLKEEIKTAKNKLEKQRIEVKIDSKQASLARARRSKKSAEDFLASLKEYITREKVTQESLDGMIKKQGELQKKLLEINDRYKEILKKAHEEKAVFQVGETDYDALVNETIEENKTFFVKQGETEDKEVKQFLDSKAPTGTAKKSEFLGERVKPKIAKDEAGSSVLSELRDLESELEELTGGRPTEEVIAELKKTIGDPESKKRLDAIQEIVKEMAKSQAGFIKVPFAGEVEIKEEKDVNELAENQASAKEEYEVLKDIWIGKKDERFLEIDVEGRMLQKTLKKALDEKKYNKDVQDVDKAIHLYIDTKNNPAHVDEFWDKLTKEQQRIIKISQNLPESTKKIADIISKEYQRTGERALSEDVIRNVKDNYAGRIWDLGNKKPSDQSRSLFGTTTRHAKKRVFTTIIEGWSNGYNLKVEGATSNLVVLKKELEKTIQDKRFLNTLKKIKIGEKAPFITHKQKEGYARVEHPNFVSWKWAGNAEADKTYGKNFFITEDGILMERKELYAPEKVAQNLNNILGTSALNRLPGVRTITKYNAIIKAWILQSSFFHHLAFTRSYWFGVRGKTIKEWSVRQSYKQGIKAIEALKPEIRLLVKNGLTLGIRQDWDEQLLHEKTIIGKILDKNSASRVVKDKILMFREWQANFLFNEFGAGLKAKSAMIELRRLQKKYPNEDTSKLAKMSANLINDDFGGLHLQRKGRNPTYQHIFRLFALAPDWTESNVQSMIKAVKGGEKMEREMYRKFWSSIITKGLFFTTVANVIMASMDDDDWWERYEKAWMAGNFRWLDVDITPLYKLFGGESEERRYFSIFGHFKDPIKFIVHPIRSAKYKGSVIFGIFMEALTGADWSGRKFTTWKELFGLEGTKSDPDKYKGKTVKYGTGRPLEITQLPSYFINQLIGSQPIQVQNFIGWLNGEMEGFEALANSMGLNTGIGYVNEAEQLERRTKKVIDNYIKKLNAPGVSAADKERFGTEAIKEMFDKEFSYSELKKFLDEMVKRIKEERGVSNVKDSETYKKIKEKLDEIKTGKYLRLPD